MVNEEVMELRKIGRGSKQMIKRRMIATMTIAIMTGAVSGCGANEQPIETVNVVETESEFAENSITATDGEMMETKSAYPETAQELFAYYDKMFNAQEPDLTPNIGEFLTEDENYEIVENADGNMYGYATDYWGGCSVWCAVSEFQEDAVATSFLAPQGNNNYEAKNLISHRRDNAWVEGVEGNGIGESISITKCYTRGEDTGEWDCFFFTDLCIVNGMAKNEQSWKANARVKTLKMYFNDEYICDLELLDTLKPQYIALGGLDLSTANGEKAVFKFEIADVYKGDVYEDTAITGIEIKFFTQNH